MTIPGGASPLLLSSEAAAPGGYQISRSLRFNSSDSGYLSRTPSTAGNRKTWTWAGWVKRSALSGTMEVFRADTSSGGTARFTGIRFVDNAFYIQDATVGSYNLAWYTAALYRDPSAWYHIVVQYDTTQASSANAASLWVNGVSQSLTFSAFQGSYSQNRDGYINATNAHYIGVGLSDSATLQNYYSGYLADIHFIDGQALTPSSFGEYDTNGVWQPIDYAGTFGTNGFHLPFSDNSTAAALGTDTSGNGNTWTVNNISVTAGAGNDSVVDSPTNGSQVDTGVGGEVVGNYCTINPLDNGGGLTLSNGNLEAENTAASSKGARCTIKIPSTGKWYFEGTIQTLGGSCALGVATSVSANPSLSAAGTWHILNYAGSGIQTYPGGRGYTFTTAQVGNVLQVAYDADSGNLWFGVNNTYCDGSTGGTGNPGAGTNPTYTSVSDVFPAVEQYTSKIACNFGQRPFAYTAPSGFKALTTANLPTPLIEDGSTVMDVKLYTGNGSTQTISGLNFEPDFVWFKLRSATKSHALYDVIRGGKAYLRSDGTVAEQNYSTGGISSFNSDGFTIVEADDVGINVSSGSQVAWTWDAGSSTVSNPDGSITSSVRANASAGFSVVTYTTPGSLPGTIGHGLGAEPYMIITKSRGAAGGWGVYHKSIGNTNLLLLNGTNASTSGPNQWNSTTPTSTVFSIGTDYATSATYVAYCFAPVAGYSSFGSYTGSGTSDGSFIFLGFRPRWFLLKPTTTADNWRLFDSARNTYNYVDLQLSPNGNGAEVDGDTDYAIDFLSNGVKIRATNSGINGSGTTFIYAAFAEHPFAYARAR